MEAAALYAFAKRVADRWSALRTFEKANAQAKVIVCYRPGL